MEDREGSVGHPGGLGGVGRASQWVGGFGRPSQRAKRVGRSSQRDGWGWESLLKGREGSKGPLGGLDGLVRLSWKAGKGWETLPVGQVR